jgi:uncharacterized membrane protein (UPF0127 family)
MHKFYILGLIFLFLSRVAFALEFDRISLIINGVGYSIEVAKTSMQRSQGLMFRTNLGIQEGMLFVYPQPGNHRIWMKNTLIPLSVIWLDENQTVIGVKTLAPCDLDPCPSYGVSDPAKYIIELSSEVRDIEKGDRIEVVNQFD